MTHSYRKLFGDRSGASAVEFALVVPLFLFMLFGIVEFSRLFWTTHALQETAIATARCMGIPQLECENGGVYSAESAIAFARSKGLAWLIQIDPSAVILDRNSSCNGLEGLSKVRIEYQFTTIVPSAVNSLAGGTDLSSEACYANY